jgi:hypothetical protein
MSPSDEMTEDPSVPPIVSVDDHVLEAPDIWTERLPRKWRMTGPRIVREPVAGSPGRFVASDAPVRDLVPLEDEGSSEKLECDVWHYEDLRFPLWLTHASAGFPPEQVVNTPVTFDQVRPGAYRLPDRLVHMNIDGVETSLVFPNIFVRFAGQRFLPGHDKELALLCVFGPTTTGCSKSGSGRPRVESSAP